MDQLTTEQIIWGLACIAAALNFGGWGSYVAMKKEREWYEGFAAGIMLGPFGVIVMACLPADRDTIARSRGKLLTSRDEDDDEKMKRYTDKEWVNRRLSGPSKQSAN